jgi:hypothetical protein
MWIAIAVVAGVIVGALAAFLLYLRWAYKTFSNPGD